MDSELKLKSLKSTRASIKGQMTKLYNYVGAVVDKQDIDGFQTKASRSKVLLKQYEDVENAIFEIAPDNESGMIDFSEQYYVVEARLNQFIREYNAANPDESNAMSNTTLNQSMTQPIEVRLPKINIEPFSGQYTEWQSFYDLYVKTIHENNNLSPAQKLQYLRGYLKGDAYNLLKHLPITETNYFEAFRKLCTRYDRKKHTIQAFIRNFMNQPTIQHATAVSVRKLLDTSDEVVRGLKALGKDAESREVWLIYMLEEKLDAETRSLWAQTSCEDDLPSLESFFRFLLNRSDALESVRPAIVRRPVNQRSSKAFITTDVSCGSSCNSVYSVSDDEKCTQSSVSERRQSIPSQAFVTTDISGCPLCNSNHSLADCEKFKKLSVAERRQSIKSANRCFNCLKLNHPVFRCLSRSRCQECGKKHHSLLHSNECLTSDKPPVTTAHASTPTSCILPTALVTIVDQHGTDYECRILLDSGSMSTLISESLCNKLKLRRQPNRTVVSGISGSGTQTTKGKVMVTLKSRINGQSQIKVEALVMAKLCSKVPARSFSPNLPRVNLALADPSFNSAQDIELILGVQHVFNVLLEGRVKQNNQVIALETIFGWVIGGEVDTTALDTISVNLGTTDVRQERVDELLQQFWEIENIPNIKRLTEEEEQCEKLFAETTYRDERGRFTVNLPRKNQSEPLGKSLNLALSRQRAMERKFSRNPEFKDFYIKFMEEYKQLEHMKEVTGAEIQELNYLPHHGLAKSSTNGITKFRVVFDASAKTSSGVSLNDTLMVGPTVQPTLYAIILRFRLHKIAISADIEKMYRQVMVRDEFKRYQAIVWRKNENDPIRYYKLTTLTYGTAAAPYLATRVLNEIANIHGKMYPIAATALKQCTYVDDIMAGADNVDQAIELKNHLVKMLADAGMRLRKWVSNSETFLQTTPIDDRTDSFKDLSQDGIMVMVLGLHWDPKLDVFSYHVRLGTPVLTKRKLLSECSQIFDPLGWLSPVIIKMKMLFQRLWLISVDWDEQLPQDIERSWLAIREQLHYLEQIQIPRWLRTSGQSIELHGFCDASERAYAAVIYVRHQMDPENYQCSLIAAKSKVAPVKKISVARLELCAAHLLTKLLKSVTEILQLPVSDTICWTDSTIVLDWLSDVPIRWQTFVGNRTSQILEVTKRENWRHVSTKDNPADCASRGLLPTELFNHQIWWSAPSWLYCHSKNWPKQQNNYNTNEEERPKFYMTLTTECQDGKLALELIDRFSNFRKIIRIIAMVQRFVSNVRKGTVKRSGPLTRRELEDASKHMCKQTQTEYMQNELRAVQRFEVLKGPLKLLHPFVDDEGLMRVGGRIQQSTVEYDTKHPIVVPPSRLAKLIIKDYHNRYHHAGFQLLSSILRQKFWLVKGKQQIRQAIRQCLACFRAKPVPMVQAMGNLPKFRIQHVRAFLQVGTDFAGPIQAFHKRGRGQKVFKAYVCLFVCTSTKAVHIELTTDLTTNSFLAALKRFVARRGLCTDIYSDCGSNYIGAEKSLREVYKFFADNTNDIYSSLLSESITWHFNPPVAPHFGGLWEAAVKSMKHHLKRVVGETILTVEELQTLLTEIEAILNSRPICAVPNDEEVDVLTPAHFIVGHPLVLVPETNITSIKLSRLHRWEMIQQMRQHIWQRWHVEYLTSMQARSKWVSAKPNAEINDIVLLIDKNVPPTKWVLGRIIQLFPGKDGLVRVVSVKTKTGIFRRAIHALCKVPVESDDSTPGKMKEDVDVDLYSDYS